MALGYSILAVFAAIASCAAAAALGTSAFGMILAYVGCGVAVLLAAVLSATVTDRDDQLHEDPMLNADK